jgi:hypothetical protein
MGEGDPRRQHQAGVTASARKHVLSCTPERPVQIE